AWVSNTDAVPAAVKPWSATQAKARRGEAVRTMRRSGTSVSHASAAWSKGGSASAQPPAAATTASARMHPDDVIRAMGRSRRAPRRRLRSPEREAHREGRSLGPRRRAGERAAELARDDVACDGEPEPRALAGGLRGEELV